MVEFFEKKIIIHVVINVVEKADWEIAFKVSENK